MLEKIRLFSNIPPECLYKLERTSSLRKYLKNTILFMEGDDNSQLFVIKSGLVCIHTDDNEGRQLVLNYMGPGEYFGELALLDDKPRSASASTVEDSTLLSI